MEFDTDALGISAIKGMEGISEGFGLFGEASILDTQAELIGRTGKINQKSAYLQGEQVQQQILDRGERFVGTQRAGYAKAGVTLSGSPISVMADTEKNFRLEAYNARLSYISKGNQLGYSAMFKEVQGKIAAGQKRTAGVAKMGKGVTDAISSYGVLSL